MTPAEAAAYARGYARALHDMAAIARQSADRLEATTRRPLAVGFGVEALRALADEAERLIRPPVTTDAKR